MSLPGDALTPGQEVVLFGGYIPAYYCDYTRGALCGGESASGGTNGTIVNSAGVIVAQGKVQDFLKTEQSKCGAARQLQIGPDGRVRCIVPPPPPPPPPAKPEPPKEEKK